MARKVKCAVTGKIGTSDEFIKINGKYYSSQEVYAEYVKSTEYWKKTIEVLAYDCMGYSRDEPFPTLLPKRLKGLDLYDNETIYRTVIYSKEAIQWSVKMKNFANDHSKINYIMAILRANINKVFKEVIAERHELAKKPKGTNAEIDKIEEVDNPKQKAKDITKFLED